MMIKSLKILSLPLMVFGLFVCSMAHGANVTPSPEKFYGKITLVNPAGKSLAVHNKKRDSDMQFSWDAQTEFATSSKESVQPSSLTVGQYVAVSYVNEGAINKATRVALRPVPFRKKTVN